MFWASISRNSLDIFGLPVLGHHLPELLDIFGFILGHHLPELLGYLGSLFWAIISRRSLDIFGPCFGTIVAHVRPGSIGSDSLLRRPSSSVVVSRRPSLSVVVRRLPSSSPVVRCRPPSPADGCLRLAATCL